MRGIRSQSKARGSVARDRSSRECSQAYVGSHPCASHSSIPLPCRYSVVHLSERALRSCHGTLTSPDTRREGEAQSHSSTGQWKPNVASHIRAHRQTGLASPVYYSKAAWNKGVCEMHARCVCVRCKLNASTEPASGNWSPTPRFF